MNDRLEESAGRMREAFKLAPRAQLLVPDSAQPEMSSQAETQLTFFNMEWHVIPSQDVVPLDDAYFARFYPMAPRGFAEPREHAPSYREQIMSGHRKHQGRIIGIETIRKPRYLPGNRQFYGTPYGFDASLDPFAFYMGRAAMTNATRYNHNYLSLRAFLSVVNEDWRTRGLLPKNYRLTICPPAIFNLIGALFHPEWSETETLELGFYRDEQGNATCYGVGSNQPGDFSYINEVELETDWTLLGFRTALVPE